MTALRVNCLLDQSKVRNVVLLQLISLAFLVFHAIAFFAYLL